MPNDPLKPLTAGQPVTHNWRAIEEHRKLLLKLQSEVNRLSSAVEELRRRLDNPPKSTLDARWG